MKAKEHKGLAIKPGQPFKQTLSAITLAVRQDTDTLF